MYYQAIEREYLGCNLFTVSSIGNTRLCTGRKEEVIVSHSVLPALSSKSSLVIPYVLPQAYQVTAAKLYTRNDGLSFAIFYRIKLLSRCAPPYYGALNQCLYMHQAASVARNPSLPPTPTLTCRLHPTHPRTIRTHPRTPGSKHDSHGRGLDYDNKERDNSTTVISLCTEYMRTRRE